MQHTYFYPNLKNVLPVVLCGVHRHILLNKRVLGNFPSLQDERMVAFHDRSPAAEVHILVCNNAPFSTDCVFLFLALQRGLHVGVQWLHNYADGAHVSGCGMLIQVCSVAHIENALDLQGDNDYKLGTNKHIIGIVPCLCTAKPPFVYSHE